MKSKCTTSLDGTKEWYLDGKRHREDGPAYESSGGTKAWWLNGVLHRKDGPAIEHSNGTKEWFLNNKNYSEQDYYKELFKRGLITEEKMFLELV